MNTTVVTGERIARLEERSINTEGTVNRIEETLNEFIKIADQRYASKWVEKVTAGAVGAILLTVLVAVLALLWPGAKSVIPITLGKPTVNVTTTTHPTTTSSEPEQDSTTTNVTNTSQPSQASPTSTSNPVSSTLNSLGLP